MHEALLVLEDGTSFRGQGFGADGTAFGEVVFNTGMSGYQEVLTDPSYHRQLVTMTYPHQGNYGITDADAESSRVQVGGFIVREQARRHSNWRAERSLDDELRAYGAVGISEIDTRRLTRHIRSAGAMRAAISTEVLDVDALVERVRASQGTEGWNGAEEVSAPEAYDFPAEAGRGEARFRVVAYDFGIKRNILRLLAAHGCDVTVVPALTPADEVLAREPDGVFLSNGPGDPAAVRNGIAAIKDVLAAEVPLFGICLGHQLLGLAAGAKSYKMVFGHRGINQPVHNTEREAVEITSHNHGFAIDAETLPSDGPFGRVSQTHVNLNDHVNEGLRLHDVPAFSVQYHPEAAPGPHDARYLFQQFCDLMTAKGNA
ncbi:MAG TPA: glutamine-hydrolyzing carbamoyl-phosphate synthase small subunit [Egibacteraceae bacterium]|nr:glutamine-hydrolyzing carbamoyl-phosphate synthase small subunit [Egibacteraceae bacterium]